MSIIAANTPLVVPVPAGFRLQFGTPISGSCVVTLPDRILTETLTDGEGLGPYQSDASVSITSTVSGTCYTIRRDGPTVTLQAAHLGQVPYLPGVSVFVGESAAGPATPAGWGGSQFQALVSGGGNSFRASGRFSAPISTFNGAASSGAFGKPADIKIPANTLVDGTGQIIVRVVVRKTGTDAASYFQIHGGPTNGTGDTNLFSGGSNVTNFSWSATGLEVVFEATFAYKSGGFGVTLRRSREGDGSLSQQVGEFTGTWNNAVDNYLNFVISSATAGNTYDLLDYTVQVFP